MFPSLILISHLKIFNLAPAHLAELHSQMRFLMSMAKAPGTKKTQDSQLKSWFKYMDHAHVTLPVGGWHLAMYATSLVIEGRVRSADSLANYVSAVRGYHRDLGMDCPTPSQFGPLDRIIKGLRKVSLRPTKRSLPITPTILLNFLSTTLPFPCCPFQAHILITYKILSLFYFLTMLRASSFLPNAYNAVDTERLVCWGNITNESFDGIPGICITLDKTKTIQDGSRRQRVPLAQNDDCPLLCPVRALALLRNMVGDHNITADTPIFQTRDYAGNLRPILRHKFENWFNFRLEEMGLDSSLYTLHAWRHGGIQQVLMSEENLALAKLTSDHSSDVILEYSNVPADRRLVISRKVNRNLSRHVMGGLAIMNDLPRAVLRRV